MRCTSHALVSLALLAGPACQAAVSAETPPPSHEPKVADPIRFEGRGQIVDCTDYMLMGRWDDTRRGIQAQNIDSGMPACFIAEGSAEVYLLLELGAQARTKFSPTETFILGDIALDGVVYQRGSLKTIAINSIQRTGRYEDRNSRRPDNQQPNRKERRPPPPPPEPGAVEPVTPR